MDRSLNCLVYGEGVSPQEILEGRVALPAEFCALHDAVEAAAAEAQVRPAAAPAAPASALAAAPAAALGPQHYICWRGPHACPARALRPGPCPLPPAASLLLRLPAPAACCLTPAPLPCPLPPAASLLLRLPAPPTPWLPQLSLPTVSKYQMARQKSLQTLGRVSASVVTPKTATNVIMRMRLMRWVGWGSAGLRG